MSGFSKVLPRLRSCAMVNDSAFSIFITKTVHKNQPTPQFSSCAAC
jgi:hypothetical protein